MNIKVGDRIKQTLLAASFALCIISTGFATSASADETCQSPYMAKITGQEDFVYVWTLGVDGLGDGQDKLVTIDVNPIVSSLLEFRMIGGIVEAPRTSSRQLATTVHVESGEPFILAGLISETERETVTKIPLLGDLPLLGKLFRSTNHKGERTEIIIVVVPKVYD